MGRYIPNGQHERNAFPRQLSSSPGHGEDRLQPSPGSGKRDTARWRRAGIQRAFTALRIPGDLVALPKTLPPRLPPQVGRCAYP